VSADEVVNAVYELLEIPVAPLVAELAEARAGLPSLADLVAGRVYRWPVVDEVLERAGRRESFVLVGPAASGKTYSLAMAGWELTTRGRVVFYVNAQVRRGDLSKIDVGRVRRRLEEALGRRVGRELVRRMVFILDRAEAAPREVGEAFERVRRTEATALGGTRRSLSHPWERESPLRGVEELIVELSEWELVKFADWLCRGRGLSLSAKEVTNLVRGAGYNPLFIAELVRGGGTLRPGSPEEVRESLAKHVVLELQRVMGDSLENWIKGLVLLVSAAVYVFQAPFDAVAVREALRSLLREEDREEALRRVESELDELVREGYLQRVWTSGGRAEHVLYHKEYARLLLKGLRHEELRRSHLPLGDWGEESFVLEVWRGALRAGGARSLADHLIFEAGDDPLAFRVMICLLGEIVEGGVEISASGAAGLISGLRDLGLEEEARYFAGRVLMCNIPPMKPDRGTETRRSGIGRPSDSLS